jgi:hypothetical protein
MLSAGQFNIEWVDNGIDYGNPEVYTMKRIKSQSSFDDERTWAYMKYDIQRFGSAAHLHYYLKCRKDDLNKAIQEQINHHEEIRWILNESVGKERAGLGFLSKILGDEKTDEIIHRFNGYGINKPENWQHWDAIFTIGDTVYLLEAKARLNESNKNENGGSSKNAIINFFKDQFPDKNVESWLGKYYQLANRLSMAVMLNRCGIKTKVVYLFFENGFKRIDGNKLDDQSATREDFENELIHKLEGLGITNEQVENLLAKVFVDVEK